MDLKNSKTEQNLKDAFAGESQANRRYLYLAQRADIELDTYNPLIPDGCNLKVTAMLEYQEVAERKKRLSELRGLEDLVWLQVVGSQKSFFDRK